MSVTLQADDAGLRRGGVTTADSSAVRITCIESPLARQRYFAPPATSQGVVVLALAEAFVFVGMIRLLRFKLLLLLHVSMLPKSNVIRVKVNQERLHLS